MKSEKIATALVRHLLTTTAVANFSLFTYHFSLSYGTESTTQPHPSGTMCRTRRVRCVEPDGYGKVVTSARKRGLAHRGIVRKQCTAFPFDWSVKIKKLEVNHLDNKGNCITFATVIPLGRVSNALFNKYMLGYTNVETQRKSINE